MKKLRAFTLIETLIVIVVFCIGILTVLQWLSQTLRNKDYANTQIKSAFLAREWIELMFNLRDANYHKELPWNCIFTKKNVSTYNENENPFCIGYFGSWDNQILKIWIWSGDEYVHVEKAVLYENFDDNLSWFQIYLHTWTELNNKTWFRYDYKWSEDEKIWFARYLLITWVVSEDWHTIIDKDKLLKIESHVLYQKWAITWEKVMETFIWNYEFNQ